MDEQETAEHAEDQLSSAGERWASIFTASQATAAHWLGILQGFAEGASSHRDLYELLRELLVRIRAAMEADNAAILLINTAGTHLDLYAASGLEEDMIGRVRVPVGRGVAGAIAASGKPMMLDDLSRIEVVSPLLHATMKSLVGAPLLAGNRVIGVIHIASAHLRRFSEADSQFLQILASCAALSVEHAQLIAAEHAAHREAETVTRQLQALRAVSDVALEHARLDDLLHALLQRMQRMLGVENAAILLPTPDGHELTLYTVRGPEEAVLGKVHVPMGQGVAGTIATTRQPLIVENLATVPVANPFLREHFHSLLGVPLLAEGRLIGVIHVDTVQLRHFTDEDRQLLQGLADRIAVAIARAQQYERVRQSRTEAERQVAVLQEAAARMDEFLSIASHELRTPLTNLAMNVQLLDVWLIADRSKRTDESLEEYAVRAVTKAQPLIQRSRRSIQRLERLVSDLLETSRIRENRVALRLQRTDLASIVHEVVAEQLLTHSTRTVRLVITTRAPSIVEADPDRIEQVVSNYLSNAFKYSQPDQPVTVVLLVEGDEARVSVHDEGLGIPASELDRIWNRFYRVAGVRHQSGSQVGLGLGLYISRDIVERHGGQVGVQSTLGAGATFWFTLPLAHSRQEG